MKFTSVQMNLDTADEVVVHTERKTVRLFAKQDGSVQVDQFDREFWEKKLGKLEVKPEPVSQ
jgi:hypothetical protein